MKQHCDEQNTNLKVTRLTLNPEGVAFNNALIDNVQENRKGDRNIHAEDFYFEGEDIINRPPSKGKRCR
jgi:hypothetical protein